MQPRGQLPLINLRLRAQSEYCGAEIFDLASVVAEGASLRSAAARAGHEVPAVRHRAAGNPGHRIAIEDRAAWSEVGEIDGPSVGGWKRQLRQRHARKVVATAIVGGSRQIGGQRIEIGHGLSCAPRCLRRRLRRSRARPHRRYPCRSRRLGPRDSSQALPRARTGRYPRNAPGSEPR